MKTHNEQYEVLQAEYLHARDMEKDKRKSDNLLYKMYQLLETIARNYVNNYCKKRNLILNDYEEKINDIATLVIQRYLTDKEFKVKRISAYVYFPMIKTLFKDKEYERRTISLNVIGEISGEELYYYE
jgi:hypothetical protein